MKIKLSILLLMVVLTLSVGKNVSAKTYTKNDHPNIEWYENLVDDNNVRIFSLHFKDKVSGFREIWISSDSKFKNVAKKIVIDGDDVGYESKCKSMLYYQFYIKYRIVYEDGKTGKWSDVTIVPAIKDAQKVTIKSNKWVTITSGKQKVKRHEVKLQLPKIEKGYNYIVQFSSDSKLKTGVTILRTTNSTITIRSKYSNIYFKVRKEKDNVHSDKWSKIYKAKL